MQLPASQHGGAGAGAGAGHIEVLVLVTMEYTGWSSWSRQAFRHAQPECMLGLVLVLVTLE